MDPNTSKTMACESISVQETWSAMESLVEKGLVRFNEESLSLFKNEIN